MLFRSVVPEDSRFPSLCIDRQFQMSVGSERVAWDLSGVIFIGHQHFTCRLYHGDGTSSFYDGTQNGGACVAWTGAEDNSATAGDGKACLLIYTQRMSD